MTRFTRPLAGAVLTALAATVAALSGAAPAHADVNAVQVSVGDQITCVIEADASLWCGDSDLGITDGLGNGHGLINVGGSISWKSVSVGDHFACAIDANSHAYCWGANGYG